MIRRKSMRAVLLNPDGEILLMKLEDPATRWQVWVTPGGAIEQGETVEGCLRRELAEETGLHHDVRVGPLVWTRTHEFDWDGRVISQREEFYLVDTVSFEPKMENNPATAEQLAFRGFRWWSTEDIRNAPDTFAPKRLADLLEALIKTGPPEEPFDAGI